MSQAIIARTGRFWPSVWVLLYALALVLLPRFVTMSLLGFVVAVAALEITDLARMAWMTAHPAIQVLYGLFLVIYVMLAVVALDFLHKSQGDMMLVFIVGVAFVSDTCAYLGGKKWGHRKLAVWASPGKTREGVVFGVIATEIFAALFLAFGWSGAHGATIFVVAAIMALAGVVGDLGESYLKRIAQVKDSGTLLGGHGGVFDRIDALVAISYVALAAVALGLLGK